ncbi:MAG TPA: DUF3597 domain-containing protein [Allosphingosinicella sp.]|nr:DUF3597 domain-containing protein [Allosphingosinicella sp.]
MGIFGKISEAIFGRRAEPRGLGQASAGTGGSTATAGSASAPAGGGGGNSWWLQAASQAQAQPQGQPQPLSETDVAASLEARAEARGQRLNWRTSIVDLMKLLDIDPSLDNRKALALELGYDGDMGDSASMNVWLHRQVMRELAANGGRVPAELTD